MWTKKDYLMNSLIDKAYAEAHGDYVRRKNEILSKLKTIKKTKDLTEIPLEWIDQIIEFIKEKEI